jgi:TIGR03009 family protein
MTFNKTTIASIATLVVLTTTVAPGQQTQQTQSLGPQQSQQYVAPQNPSQVGSLRQNDDRLVPKPAEFPVLPPEHVKYVDDILSYWESSSSKIERFQCKFQRWNYDEAFLAVRDPRTGHLYARTVATGVVKYVAPDKGKYESDNVWKFEKPPEAAGAEPEYVKIDENEKWICDGQSIFEYVSATKKLIERGLPEEMKGQNISNGPIPFLFGAKADEMRARYWIRCITPQDVKGEYWLEAWPKRAADAQDMKKVEVVLDEKDFLPKALTIYEVNHDAQQQMTRKTTFEFTDRQYNWQVLPFDLQKFVDEFHRPRTPLGWEKVVVPANGPDPRQAQAVDPNANR